MNAKNSRYCIQYDQMRNANIANIEATGTGELIMNDAALEEDWSSYMKESSLNGFAEHASELIDLPDGQTIRLRCVTELTPYDVMRLYKGDHDATGNMIWMGGLFFAEAFSQLEKSLFADRRVMELGSGTGFGGISLFMLTSQANCSPKKLVLTDANPTSLQLCRENCALNPLCDDRIVVMCLDWNDGTSSQIEKFDTIFCTDVVYDVSAVIPLLSTASRHLDIDGKFLLSHIPRASLPGASKIASAEEMEGYLSESASNFSLRLVGTVRPFDLSSSAPGSEHLDTITRMHDAGAAILRFTKDAD